MKQNFLKIGLWVTAIAMIAAGFSGFTFASTRESNPPAPPDGAPLQGGPGGEPLQGGMAAGGPPPGGGASKPESYTAVNEYTADATVDGETIVSTGTDENAVLVSGGQVLLKNVSIERTSADSTGGDTSSFYGVGAAVLATGGSAFLEGGTIQTDAPGGAGAFAYGDGEMYLSGTTIRTARDTSGGVHAAGGGKLYAWDLTVETDGESAAAIRSDRGGGVMRIDGGTYVSNGVGSPVIYSTADIAVHNADLTANGSEAVCIEGLNSLRLFDSTLTGNMADLSQNDTTWNVILYQSMSGDSELGNSTFEMIGGKLTAKNGGMFYSTNTESTFILKGVEIIAADENDYFLKVTGNTNQRGWGTAGANGADTLFTAIAQDMIGDILWDTISQLDFYMIEGSTLTGAVLNDESAVTQTGDGTANLTISADSVWTVTADSRLGKLSNAGSIVDSDGKSVSIVGADGTEYVRGDSALTVTVDAYEADADISGASTPASWEELRVELPAALQS